MTIEIRQLIIRASVSARPEPGASPHGPATPAIAAAPDRLGPSLAAHEQQRDALIDACVREVLRKLEKARER